MNLYLFKKLPPRFESHLRERREAAGLSTDDLAEYCMVSNQTIVQIEEGSYEPSVVLAEHLAQKLGTTVEALFVAGPPTIPGSAEREERIRSQIHRKGYYLLVALLFLSLAAALILQSTNYSDLAGYIGLFWMVLTVAFVTITLTVKESFSYSRKLNRTWVKSKRNRILLAASSGIIFGAIMTFLLNDGKPPRILSFVVMAVLFGALEYWTVWRKSR